MTSASTLPGPAERLRDAAADRLPPRLQAPVPWRAVALALVLAVVVAVVAFARASAAPAAASTAVPARTSFHPRTSAVSWASPSAGPTGPPADPAAAALPAATPSGVLVVDVAGQVTRPGLVRLPPGSRVWDAVVAAGGPSSQARLERLNLARPLQDGEQVVVPGATDPVATVGVAGPTGPAGGAGVGAAAASGATGGGGAGGPVDLNAATAEQLDTLPGVGPVLAGRIVTWRAQHGRFTRVEELGEVPGIGPKLLAQLRPLVRVA